jgi:hypothetical protein
LTGDEPGSSLGWLDTSSQDPANIVIQRTHEHRRRAVAAIIASQQDGWHPGMLNQGQVIVEGGGQKR